MALLNYTVDKWEFVGPSVLRTAGAFFTTAQAVLHHAQRAFFTTAAAVPSPKYREHSEPNSEPRLGAI